MNRKLLSFFACMFTFFAQAQFEINQPSAYIQCAESEFVNFTLGSQTSVILGALNPAEYTVTYHISVADAQTGNNPIPSIYSNITNPQTIHARVKEISSGNYETTNFDLIVFAALSINDVDFTTCDIDAVPNDQITTIAISSASQYLYDTWELSSTEASLTLHFTQSDALNGTNPISVDFQNTQQNQVVYSRVTNLTTGCVSLADVTLTVVDCTVSCSAPINLMATDVTDTSLTFSWTPTGTETQWEVILLPPGSPVPQPSVLGIPVTTNPFTLTGLSCPTSYDVYVRAVCSTQISNWSAPIFVMLDLCDNVGRPIDLVACIDGDTACFDLSVNDAYIKGSIEPWMYGIYYYESKYNAENNIDIIFTDESNYCIPATVPTRIWVRLLYFPGPRPFIFSFLLLPQNDLETGEMLPVFRSCDDDGDGTAIFDLTAAPGIGSGDLEFYTSVPDLLNQTNAIANPAEYLMSTENIKSNVFFREIIDSGCDNIHTLPLLIQLSCNFSDTCSRANSLCNALGVPFPNVTGIAQAEEGNDYGCLSDTSNPTWFYFPVSNPGNINLILEQGSTPSFTQANLNLNYICYGPFTDLDQSCGQLTEDYVVDCSYSLGNVESLFIPNAQPGELYLIMVTNYSNEPGFIRISESTGTTGEIGCAGLRLNAFLDSNANGTHDSGEMGFPMGQFAYERNGDGQVHHVSVPTGVHRIYDINENNEYDISYVVNTDYAAQYNVSIPSYNSVSPVVGMGLQQYDFAVVPLGNYTDLGVTMVSTQPPRPGFSYTHTITYFNNGSQPISGTLTFVKDPVVTITANSQTGVVNNTDGFTYAFTNLLPFESRTISVTLQVPVIPTVQLGDLLTNQVSVTLPTGDIAPTNNEAISAEVVIGSYDPNDKMESRGPKVLIDEFTTSDYLYYTIRFENTGTAEAINVRINDVLDPQLDPASVIMVSASREYVLDRVDDRLTWRFENIMLPPTIWDPVGSHGYVQFRVKPYPGFTIGDVIPNTASIYFDFNPAIVTNTFETEFVETLGLSTSSQKTFAIYPNPASGQCVIAASGISISKVSVSDLTGKTVLVKTNDSDSLTLDISTLQTGLYMVRITADDGRESVKKLIVR